MIDQTSTRETLADIISLIYPYEMEGLDKPTIDRICKDIEIEMLPKMDGFKHHFGDAFRAHKHLLEQSIKLRRKLVLKEKKKT